MPCSWKDCTYLEYVLMEPGGLGALDVCRLRIAELHATGLTRNFQRRVPAWVLWYDVFEGSLD
jgi:hypothetical protein